MSAPLLNLQNIVYTLGGHPLLEGADLSLSARERICLVGRNGSGKSTLLRIAAGLLQPDGGTRFAQPGTKIHYLAQDPDLSIWETAFDYVSSSLEETEHYQARAFLHELGLTGEEKCASLSGGEARRCALAHALAAKPDLILLDEPTNHLDLPCIAWLERELLSSGAAMVIISHDRRFLENLCQHVVWLEQGKTRYLEAGFAHFEVWRDEQIELAERESHKLDRQIAREEDWMRYGVTARRKRNVRRVAELAQLRSERRDIASRQRGTMKIEASAAENTSKIVISAENISWAYPSPSLSVEKGVQNPVEMLIDNLTLKVLRGDRLGLCGANGAGKTTLLEILTGKRPPQTGEIRLSPSVQMVTLDQQRSVLGSDKARYRTIVDILTDGYGDMIQVGAERRHVMGYMKDFLFRPEQARTPVAHLSGGERGRLALACALARPSNLLVLDEPTNDLDLETLDLLQEMLDNYNGTILLVSHDRDFLDRVVSSILVAEGAGCWLEYAGGYSDMLAQRQGQIPAERPAIQNVFSEKTAPIKSSHGKLVKLSYKDQRELDNLPHEMEKLEKDIQLCRKALSDPELYVRDSGRFEKLTNLLEERESQLVHLEERWLLLEEKRENPGQ